MKSNFRVLAGVLMIVLLAVFMTACGGGGGGGSSDGGNGGNGEVEIDLTGDWEGTWDSNVLNGGGSVTVSWTQSGSSITGTYSITLTYSDIGVFICDPQGSMSGTISGNEIVFGTYSGGIETGIWTGTFTSTSMSGTYSVTSGPCIGDTGTFLMNKVNGGGDTSTALVVEEFPGYLSRVDLSTGSVTIVTADLDWPKDVAITSDGTTAYVAEWGGQSLSKVNLSTGETTQIATFTGIAQHPRLYRMNQITELSM